MSAKLNAIGGVLLVAGAGAFALWAGWFRATDASPSGGVAAPAPNRDVPAQSRLAAGARQRGPSAPPKAAGASDEASLMAGLRELGQAAPRESLALARAGNARFPDSPDAPERAWFVARSLVNLGRFHEARDEAQLMVRRYPDTNWTRDVQRHLLVHPLDQPSREAMQQQL